MADHQEANDCSTSTTWGWRYVKIPGSPEAPKGQRAKRPSQALQSVWDGRHALTITIRSRGGAECWYEIKARGKTTRLPGHLALHDVMTRIYGGTQPER